MEPADQGPQPPEPPWLRPARRAAPRTPLDREAIVEAALRLIDRDGVDGLSMRRLAAELGTTAGALYWHVANKEQLLMLVFDRVAGEIQLPEPDPERWREQVTEACHEMLRVLLAHRDVARISLGRIPVGPNLVRFVEWSLTLMRGAGFPDRIAAYAGDLIGLYVGAIGYERSLGLVSPDGVDRPPEEVIEMIGGYFASLPPEQFPHTTSMAATLMSGGEDERFALGLDVIIDGLVVQAGLADR